MAENFAEHGTRLWPNFHFEVETFRWEAPGKHC